MRQVCIAARFLRGHEVCRKLGIDVQQAADQARGRLAARNRQIALRIGTSASIGRAFHAAHDNGLEGKAAGELFGVPAALAKVDHVSSAAGLACCGRAAVGGVVAKE